MPFSIPEGDLKAEYLQKKFSGIAGKYDFFNDLVTQGMHRYWKRFLVKKTGIQPGDRVLDICCGTGDISQLLLGAVGPHGLVTGLDFSPGMLTIASARKNASEIQFIQGDAMNLPANTGSMDAVTVGYGLRNLVDITKSLNDVYRVLKPGGRFLCLDMGKVKLPIVRQLFDFYFFRIVPLLGKLIYPKEDLFDYFPESSVEYPSQDKLAKMLTEVGFRDVTYFNFYFGSTTIHYAVKPPES